LNRATLPNQADAFFPVLPVERNDVQEVESTIKASRIYVEAARMRSWPTERVDPADFAETVLRDSSIESIGSENFVALQ
jgi:hypothetical protein